MKVLSTVGIAFLLAACGQASGLPAPTAPSSSAAQSSPSKQGAPSAAALGTLNVAYTTLNAGETPLWLADATHGFADRNLEVRLQYLDGTLGSKAIVANELDVLMVAPASPIAADLNGGQDLVVIGSILNHPTFALNAASSIKVPADLRGKIVATDLAGSANQYGTLIMLNDVGLSATDVTLRSMGVTEVQFAALTSGQVQAATLTPPFSFQAQAKGFAPITTSYKLPYQSWSFVVRRSRIEALSPMLVAFLRACQQAVVTFNTQPDLAMKTIQQYTKESDPAILQQTYDFYKTQAPFQTDLQPTLDGIQSLIDFLGNSTLPAAKGAKASQFVDTRFLSQLPKV